MMIILALILSSCEGLKMNIQTAWGIDDQITELQTYLSNCVSKVEVPPDAFEKHYADDFAEHPGTTSGKHIQCLAQHPNTNSMAVFFYGFPGPNGVFSAARGAKIRANEQMSHDSSQPSWSPWQKSHGKTQVRTAEADPERCAAGSNFLKNEGLADYVQLNCGIACGKGNDADCLEDLKQTFCPTRLDVATVDFSLGLPPKVYEGMFKACDPKILLVENSLLPAETVQHYDGHEPDSHSNYNENATEGWHAFERRFHDSALHGTGSYKLVVDSKNTNFRGGDDRHFSIYYAKNQWWR